jgi:hypothetical protein
MITEIITRTVTQFLNWHSVQKYYADFGDTLPKIYVTAIEILGYLALFGFFYVIASWILYPVSARWRANAKSKEDAENTTQIINLLTEQNLILLSTNAEVRKANELKG